MPVPVKIETKFIQFSGWGWGETHYALSPDDTPNLKPILDNYISNVASWRGLLLGSDTAIVGYRASYPSTIGVRSLGVRLYAEGDTTQSSTDFAQSLAINFHDATFSRRKIVHMRGFWDAVEADSGYVPFGAAGWDSRFTQWKNALIAGGYGWLSRDAINSRTGTVLGYVENVDGTITFTLGAPGLDNVAAGETVTLAFSRINGSRSVLNRTLLCRVTNATTVVTTAPIAAGAFNGQGRYIYRRTEFLAYAALGSVSVGKRAMGKPLDRQPGRSKARART